MAEQKRITAKNYKREMAVVYKGYKYEVVNGIIKYLKCPIKSKNIDITRVMLQRYCIPAGTWLLLFLRLQKSRRYDMEKESFGNLDKKKPLSKVENKILQSNQ